MLAILFLCLFGVSLLTSIVNGEFIPPIKESKHPSLTQQNFTKAPPFPIMEIGLRYMLAQLGQNTTNAEQESLLQTSEFRRKLGLEKAKPAAVEVPLGRISRNVALNKRVSPAMCGPGWPCLDGSCCNSEGKCGFTKYTCSNTAQTTCISNCGAHAMCGVDSLYGEKRCPLNICCSYFGYCGTTSVHCAAPDAAGIALPCQEGYGSCGLKSAPFCGDSSLTTTMGRKVAYYQASNVKYRACNRISPSQINTRGLTHLNFAFAFIDPISFKIVPSDDVHLMLYPQFTALKTPILQTWIAVGGFDFNDPGPTHTTFSELVTHSSNRAAFIKSVIQFMDHWGFQGIDLDWEFPSQNVRGGQDTDAGNLVNLVHEMRVAFGTNYGISTVLPPDFGYLAGNDPTGMAPNVDFFNFMSYDLHGPWESGYLGATIRPQTPLPDIDSGLLPLWFDGVPPYKLNLGIAYYGRGYTASSKSCLEVGCPYIGANKPGSCTNSPGVLSLREIDGIIAQKGLKPKLLPDLMVKQIVWDDQWIGYDDNETIALKMRWGDKHCLGGIAVWSIDFNSGAGSGDSPLTLSTDGTCSTNGKTCQGSPFGNCCSSHNYCGITPAHCLPSSGCQLSFGTCTLDTAAGVPIQTTKVSTDGSCSNSKTCAGSSFGKCCSKSGFCGSSPLFCSPSGGCQADFGLCIEAGAGIHSIDGRCGKEVQRTCQGSQWGNCCSGSGWCGGENDYCTIKGGCQPEYGTCA